MPENGRNAITMGQFSRGVILQPIETETTFINGSPYLFADPTTAYRSIRNARAGEEGSRNSVRLPSYTALDAALSKSFKLPYGRDHRVEIRWEVFNLTNTQPFGVVESLTLDQDPFSGTPSPAFGRFIGSQTPVGETRPGRVMQFAVRYTF